MYTKGHIHVKDYFGAQTAQTPTQETVDTHRLVYQGLSFTCNKCPFFSTNTAANLCQHERGKCGKGWRALCGQHFDWLPKCHRHMKKCSKCKALKAEAKERAERLAKKLSKKSEHLHFKNIIYPSSTSWYEEPSVVILHTKIHILLFILIFVFSFFNIHTNCFVYNLFASACH